MFVQPAVRTVRADDPNEREHQFTVITLIASPSDLPVGSRCRVELNSETNDQNEVVEVVYEGKIAEANDEGITMTVASERRTIISGSAASRLPLLNRLFRNVGIAEPNPGNDIDI